MHVVNVEFAILSNLAGYLTSCPPSWTKLLVARPREQIVHFPFYARQVSSFNLPENFSFLMIQGLSQEQRQHAVIFSNTISSLYKDG